VKLIDNWIATFAFQRCKQFEQKSLFCGEVFALADEMFDSRKAPLDFEIGWLARQRLDEVLHFRCDFPGTIQRDQVGDFECPHSYFDPCLDSRVSQHRRDASLTLFETAGREVVLREVGSG
jgi:hypothetical protein